MKNACLMKPYATVPRRTLFAWSLAACALCLAPSAAHAVDGSRMMLAQANEVGPAEPTPPAQAEAPGEPMGEASPLPEDQAGAQAQAEAPVEVQPGAEAPAAPAPEEQPQPQPGVPPAGVQPPAQPPLVPRPPRPLRPTGAAPRQRGAQIPPAPTRSGKASVEPAQDVPSDDLSPTEPINFNFEDSDLLQVIESIAPYTGKNFDVPPEVAGQKVTIIMHDPIPAGMAYEVLESVLSSRSFALVPSVDGKLVKVVAAGQGMDKVPLVKGAAEPQGFDRLSTHIVGLQNAAASEVSALVKGLGTQTGTVDVYAPTNTLIITDTADAIRRMLEFIDIIDVPGVDTEQQIFMLEYTDAQTVATQIQEVLTGGAAAGQPGVPGQPQMQPQRPPARPPLRPAVPGAPRESTVVGAREPILRIVPDTRLNALIVVASPGFMEQVRDLVDKLDTPTPFEAGNMHIYELQNANAEDIVDALNGLTGRASSAPSGGGGGTTGGSAGGASMGGGGGSVGGGGGAPSAQVTTFEREVSITQYEVTNSLLVVASPQDYKRLTEVIARLDVPQRQVHVDATIMEVGINDNFSLAVETTALKGDDGFALNNVVALANLLTQGPLAATSAGTTVGIIDGTTDIIVAGEDGSTSVQTIPNVPLLLTALESITDLNVLSRPSLTTVDNQEANIVDGLNIPFVRGTSSSLDQSAVGRSVYNSVDREDVGMKLKVKPQISEGDYVYLELEVELSQPVQSNVGADPNVVGPTIQKTNVTNHVVIKDGSIGVIGGFLRETTDRSVRQPPVLGDVPLMGWLFRRKDNTRAKRNLVMLVTPHVIKERKDLDRVSQFKLDQFQEANADVIFEKGFVRRIEEKQRVRNQRHPSVEKATELQGQSKGFGRGTIEK